MAGTPNDGASVEAVMRAAGMTVGGFYAHFASKDDLARQALLYSVEQSFARLTEGLEDVESWTGRLLTPAVDITPIGVSNRFKAGDTLFGKLRPYLAKASNVDFEGICSSELLVLRPVSLDRRFFLFTILCHYFGVTL